MASGIQDQLLPVSRAAHILTQSTAKHSKTHGAAVIPCWSAIHVRRCCSKAQQSTARHMGMLHATATCMDTMQIQHGTAPAPLPRCANREGCDIQPVVGRALHLNLEIKFDERISCKFNDLWLQVFQRKESLNFLLRLISSGNLLYEAPEVPWTARGILLIQRKFGEAKHKLHSPLPGEMI